MGSTVKIVFNPMDKVIEVEKGAIILDAIRQAGINIRSICGGEGECGTCKVLLNKGEVSNISTKSSKWLTPHEMSEGYYLACQTRVLSDCELTIPVESRIDRPKILLNMEMTIDTLDPASKNIYSLYYPREATGRTQYPFMDTRV